jgi:hypothetical protein
VKSPVPQRERISAVVKKAIICLAENFIVAKFRGVKVLIKAILFSSHCWVQDRDGNVLITLTKNGQPMMSGVSDEFEAPK